MADKKNAVNIIIKRIEEGHHGHHGGGWKVAYADFMTAMMAFFLLLWILAQSDEEARRGLADYFTPSVAQTGGRGWGLLEGTVLGEEGVLSGSEIAEEQPEQPSFGQESPLAVFDSRLRPSPPPLFEDPIAEAEPAEAEPVESEAETEAEPGEAEVDEGAEEIPATEEAIARELAAAAEEAREAEAETLLEELQDEIGNTIRETPELQVFNDSVVIDRVPEGVRIQLIDQENLEMFPLGSSDIKPSTRRLLEVVTEAITHLDHPLRISGHTDSRPYSNESSYGNWELSADRANATRRILLSNGIGPGQIAEVSGFADTQLLDPENPNSAANRRVSIILLTEKPN